MCDQDTEGKHGGWGQGAYATEHWAKARYSSRTSRPRFSSLRNSCTHLQSTRFSELHPERLLPKRAMSRQAKQEALTALAPEHNTIPTLKRPRGC